MSSKTKTRRGIAMDVGKFMQGAFLRAQDLDEGDVVTTVTGSTTKDFDDGERIIMATEFGSVVLNKTNLKRVAGAFGSDTERWVGRSVKLCKEETNFAGKQVPCIRVYPDIPKETRPLRDTRKVETRPKHSVDPEDIPF
jgi:hypothetical protein